MRLTTPLYITLLCLCAFFVSLMAHTEAEARTPLLLEGKKTLYQRVVTHPGAMLHEQPEETSGSKPLKTFSAMYVFERKDGWIEAGASPTESTGWIKASHITDWPQALTLLFTDQNNRMPVMFFKSEKELEAVCNTDDIKAEMEKIEESAGVPNANAESLPILAIEPSGQQGAISRNRFYLMPIQKIAQPFEGTSFLQVASIDPGSGKGNKGAIGGSGNAATGENSNKMQSMRTGIAFVVDTTISMKPYIEQSLNVIRTAFDSIEKEQLGDNVGYAVVAFRNNTSHNKDIGYVTMSVSDFVTVKDRTQLEEALSKVDEAPVSTHSFNEDSLAGVKVAVDDLKWEDYQSKIIVLITDAGPLPSTDPFASQKMGPVEMHDYAKAKNIWITVAHIRAPNGAKDHAYAEKAYRALSTTAGGKASYIAIPAPTPKQGAESFAKAAKSLAESLTKVVKVTSERKMLPKPVESVQAESPEDEAKRIGEAIGYAMQLEFLGQQKENRAPSVVNAWIADMDLPKLGEGLKVPTVEVAVLLTKNQLSDLQRQLKIIIDEAERTKRTDSKDFFSGILSASAQMARDPERFRANPGQNLQQLGVLGEFLDDLPYKSDIMLLQEDDWYRMSVGEQTAFINRLKSRIARYEEYDKDRSNWESFGAENAGDWVYRVPLSMLP